jgi:hypothetical protein
VDGADVAAENIPLQPFHPARQAHDLVIAPRESQEGNQRPTIPPHRLSRPVLQWFVELPLGGGLTNKKSKLVDVTHEAFLAMISAVSRAPGEIIRVVLGDFGNVFCSTEIE